MTPHQLSEIKAEIRRTALIPFKDILTIEEASAFTGLTIGTLKNYVFQKKIGAYKPGVGHSAKLYFDKGELESYMRQNRISSDADITAKATTYNFKKAS